MKKYLWLAALFCAAQAHAYTTEELLGDCQAAEETYAGKKNSDPFHAIRSARCIAYVAGFADGYAVSDHLAESVGVKLNALCLPKTPDLSYRLVRSLLAHLDRLPPNPGGSTASLVAAALSRTFACTEPLEPKK